MTDATAFESVLSDISYRRQATEDSLRREAESLILDLQRMIKSLDEDMSINPLGVVQSSGRQIDILCAQRHAFVQEAKKVEWLQGKVS